MLSMPKNPRKRNTFGAKRHRNLQKYPDKGQKGEKNVVYAPDDSERESFLGRIAQTSWEMPG